VRTSQELIEDGKRVPESERERLLRAEFPHKVYDVGKGLVTVIPELGFGDEYDLPHELEGLIDPELFDVVAIGVDKSAIEPDAEGSLNGEYDELANLPYSRGERGMQRYAFGRKSAYPRDLLNLCRDRGVALQVEHLHYPSSAEGLQNPAFIGGELLGSAIFGGIAIKLLSDIDPVGRIKGEIARLGEDIGDLAREQVEKYAREIESWRGKLMADPNLRASGGTFAALFASWLGIPWATVEATAISSDFEKKYGGETLAKISKFAREQMATALRQHPEYGVIPAQMLALAMRMRHASMVISELGGRKSTQQGWEIPEKPSIAVVTETLMADVLDSLLTSNKMIEDETIRFLAQMSDEYLLRFIGENGGVEGVCRMVVWLPNKVEKAMVKKVLVDSELRGYLKGRFGEKLDKKD